jgi:hypothetical protein
MIRVILEIIDDPHGAHPRKGDQAAQRRAYVYRLARRMSRPAQDDNLLLGQGHPASAQTRLHDSTACRRSSGEGKYTAKRDAAYQQGLAEAPALRQEPTFRDFVVLYLAEGTKTRRNELALVNSYVAIVKLAHHWIRRLTHKPQKWIIGCKSIAITMNAS